MMHCAKKSAKIMEQYDRSGPGSDKGRVWKEGRGVKEKSGYGEREKTRREREGIFLRIVTKGKVRNISFAI